MNTHNNFGSSHEQPQGGGQAAHEASTRRSETFVLLLTLLEDESAHAVMLKRRVEQVSDTSLEPGTFYGALARLEKDGLVGVSSRNVSARVYSLTERGQEALQRHRYILQERRERLEPAARESFFKERTMRLATWLVKLYPQAWRRRYEEEMLMVLEGHHITFLTLLDLLFGALNARLDPHYRSEEGPVSFKRKNAATFAFIAGMALSILCMHSWYVQCVTFLLLPSDVHWGIPVVGSIMNQMSGYVIYLALVAGNALIFTSFIKQMMRTGRKGTMIFAAICFTPPFFVVAWLIQAEPILPSVHPGVPVIWLAVCYWLITWSGLELVMGALFLTVVRVRDAITERKFKLLSMIVAINLLLIIFGYLQSTTTVMLIAAIQPTFPFYNPVITFQPPQVAWLQVVNTLATLFPFVGLSTFLLAFVESEKSSRMWRAILIFACLFTLAMGAYLISFLWTWIDNLLQLRVLSLQALQSSDFFSIEPFSVTAAMGCVAGMTVAVVLLFKALKQGLRSPVISSAGTSSEASQCQPPMMQQ